MSKPRLWDILHIMFTNAPREHGSDNEKLSFAYWSLTSLLSILLGLLITIAYVIQNF